MFDPQPLRDALDAVRDQFHAARADAIHDVVVRFSKTPAEVHTDQWAVLFDARIDQCQALLDEVAHHVNDYLHQPEGRDDMGRCTIGGYLPDAVHGATIAQEVSV